MDLSRQSLPRKHVLQMRSSSHPTIDNPNFVLIMLNSTVELGPVQTMIEELFSSEKMGNETDLFHGTVSLGSGLPPKQTLWEDADHGGNY